MRFTTRRGLRIVAALVFTLAIIGAAIPSRIPQACRKVLLPLEFATAQTAVDRLAPRGSDTRAGAMTAQQIDFAFIANYWLFFATTGLLFFRTSRGTWRATGAALILVGTAAALCDWRENQAILGALGPGAAPFASPAGWALWKWRLVFLSFLLVAVLLLWPLHRHSVVRVLRVAAGVLLLAGALTGARASADADGIRRAMNLAGSGTFLLALVCIWYPDDIIDSA